MGLGCGIGRVADRKKRLKIIGKTKEVVGAYSLSSSWKAKLMKLEN